MESTARCVVHHQISCLPAREFDCNQIGEHEWKASFPDSLINGVTERHHGKFTRGEAKFQHNSLSGYEGRIDSLTVGGNLPEVGTSTLPPPQSHRGISISPNVGGYGYSIITLSLEKLQYGWQVRQEIQGHYFMLGCIIKPKKNTVRARRTDREDHNSTGGKQK